MTRNNGTTPGLNTPAHIDTPPAKRQYLARILKAFPGTSSAAQCQRLREALGRYSLSTFEAMRYLDCYHAPARVMQLRDEGVGIDTQWVQAVTESGERHRVGLYVLAPGAKGRVNG
jgi:hypothetical protein